MAIFAGEPGLAGTRMSYILNFIGVKGDGGDDDSRLPEKEKSRAVNCSNGSRKWICGLAKTELCVV